MKTTINKIYAFIAMCLACIPMLFTSCESLDQYPEDYFTGKVSGKTTLKLMDI